MLIVMPLLVLYTFQMLKNIQKQMTSAPHIPLCILVLSATFDKMPLLS